MEENKKGPIQDYVAVDIEATGIDPSKSKIIEIGAIKVRNGQIVDQFLSFADPKVKLEEQIEELTHITNDMLMGAPDISQVIPEFLAFSQGDILLGHNVLADYSYLKYEIAGNGILKDSIKKYDRMGLDTFGMAKRLLPVAKSRTLEGLCQMYGIENKGKHRALYDAMAAKELYDVFVKEFYLEREEVFLPTQLRCKVKKQKQITKHQKIYLNDLLKYHRIEFEGCVDNLTMSEASRMIDRLILEHGRL